MSPPLHIFIHKRGRRQSILGLVVRFGLYRPLPGLLSLQSASLVKKICAQGAHSPTHLSLEPQFSPPVPLPLGLALARVLPPWSPSPVPLPQPPQPPLLPQPCSQPVLAAKHRALQAPLPVGAATASSPPPTSAARQAATNSAAGEAVSPNSHQGAQRQLSALLQAQCSPLLT